MIQREFLHFRLESVETSYWQPHSDFKYQMTQPVTLLGITQQRAREPMWAKILSCPAFLLSLILGYENQVTPRASGSKSESHGLLLLFKKNGAD